MDEQNVPLLFSTFCTVYSPEFSRCISCNSSVGTFSLCVSSEVQPRRSCEARRDDFLCVCVVLSSRVLLKCLTSTGLAV